MPRGFKDPDKFASFGEIKEAYKKAIKALDRCQRERQLAFATSSSDRKQLTETRAEVKETRKDVEVLTTRAAQASTLQKQGAISSSVSAFVFTSLYYYWNFEGYPGGSEWEPYFHDAAVTAAIMWSLTNAISWLQKIYHATS